MDDSPPGSSVHGISQARILEWVAISFSRGSSPPRVQTCGSCISCFGRQDYFPTSHQESQLVFIEYSIILFFYPSKDWGLPGSFVHRIFQARKRVGCHFLLQGIFPTQESKSHLQNHCSGRRILHHWDTWQANSYLKIYNATNTIKTQSVGALYI